MGKSFVGTGKWGNEEINTHFYERLGGLSTPLDCSTEIGHVIENQVTLEL